MGAHGLRSSGFPPPLYCSTWTFLHLSQPHCSTLSFIPGGRWSASLGIYVAYTLQDLVTPSPPPNLTVHPLPFHSLKGRVLEASSPLQSLTFPLSVHSPLGPELGGFFPSSRPCWFYPQSTSSSRTAQLRPLPTQSSLLTSATRSRGRRRSALST